MSELSVGTLSGLAANSYVIDVASGSQLTQPGMSLQVVSATDSTDITTTSTSYVDVTGMSVTITPSSTNSTILLLVSVQSELSWTSGTTDFNRHEFEITDSSNVAITGGELFKVGTGRFDTTSSASNNHAVMMLAYDSPASTSAQTYKLRHRSSNANCTAKVQSSQKTAQFLAIEIAG